MKKVLKFNKLNVLKTQLILSKTENLTVKTLIIMNEFDNITPELNLSHTQNIFFSFFLSYCSFTKL